VFKALSRTAWLPAAYRTSLGRCVGGCKEGRLRSYAGELLVLAEIAVWVYFRRIEGLPTLLCVVRICALLKELGSSRNKWTWPLVCRRRNLGLQHTSA
jgi:hypothetical protein